jgi:hypothetical protein
LTQRDIGCFCVRAAIILSHSDDIGTRLRGRTAQGIYSLLADDIVVNKCDASAIVKRRKLRSRPGLKFNGMVTLGKLPFACDDDWEEVVVHVFSNRTFDFRNREFVDVWIA